MKTEFVHPHGHNTDGKRREKRCRRIRPKWSASDQETWEPAQELQRHQKPHLPPSDLLDCRVDDIDRCRHPRLVNLTDVEPRQQLVEKRFLTTRMHCFFSHGQRDRSPSRVLTGERG